MVMSEYYIFLLLGLDIGGLLLDWSEGIPQLDSQWALVADLPEAVRDGMLDDSTKIIGSKPISCGQVCYQQLPELVVMLLGEVDGNSL